ncbi:branched-chain amino acid ABC transporter permease [Lacisediminimonas profundi]|uniref:branched-chain amino acid ABC transporter permease n=1 Tax=Lacisediminimonas profundi TaxID=2603856 RepID=UPI00124AE5EB|nr:branched-chain amino acid ABC transporter permease [Lacisediminimonas profundi]
MADAILAQQAGAAAGVLPARNAVQESESSVRRASRLLAVVFILIGLLFAGAAWVSGDTFFFRLATEALIYGGFAMSVDLLLGFTGLLSLGHALFFGLGAYVAGLVLKELTPSFWLALLVVAVAATLIGALAGFIAIKARGVYFALITFGLAEVVAKAVFNTREIGGSDGIIGIPVVKANFLLFSVDAANPLGFFLLVLAMVMGMYFLLAYLLDTPFGRLMKAVRANETRVPFLGFHAGRVKLVAFILAANVAALSGALYPMLRGFVSPELLYFQTSGNAVITVIVGGLGTLIGPLYGSVLLTGLKSVLGTYTEHHLIVIGVLFMLSVIFFPKGLIGYLHPRLAAWLARRKASQ